MWAVDTGDLGEGIGVVGPLERPGEHCVFADRLRAITRVNARAAQVEQLRDARSPCGPQHRGVKHQVIIEEIGRAGRVRRDAADGACRVNDKTRAMGIEPPVNCGLIAEIEFGSRRRKDRPMPATSKRPHDRRTDQTAMAGNEDRRVRIEDDGHVRAES
jgi:hypothetical protein